MYPHVHNVLALKGKIAPSPFFETLIDPFEPEGTPEQTETEVGAIETPAYVGSGWYGYTYKTHLAGARNWWRLLRSPKRLLFTGPAHLERPFHTLHGEILRWHDHWLKGIDTGVVDDPPVRYWLMGANESRRGRGLAATGDGVDAALVDELGASTHAPVHGAIGRRRDPAGLLRPDASYADAQCRVPPISQRAPRA